MKFYCRVVPYLILVVLLAACGAASAATRVQDGDAGTIGACLAQPDGARGTLTGEEVLWRGKSGKSFAIKEWFDVRADNPQLVVVSTSQLPVEEFWSVDVTGTLRTAASRNGGSQRVLVVSPADVQVYCSANGRPCPFIPVKASGTEWSDKMSLVELAASAQSARTFASLADAQLPPMPDSPESEPSPPAAGSRDSLKWLPGGAPVSINGAVVSAGFSDYGFFYVEKADRSFGIWIKAPDYVWEGQLLDITGRMATSGGERLVLVDPGGVSYPDYSSYPRPLEVGMPNKMLGGGPVGLWTPGVADATGLNNTGLLARIWGRVTAVDEQYPMFWIDDGSGVASDGGHVGVKVYDVTYDPLPSVNDYVTLSGVSSAETPLGSGTSMRVLWKTGPVTRSTQPGAGTISGTIAATGANGKTVRVFCGSASTTATFSGNTANYTLAVPYGDHAVTAGLLGYKTSTQLATLSSGTPVDLDFILPAVARVIDVAASPSRIPPDGVSQMTITAIVRDEEGRRYGSEPITWNVDLGSVISSDVTTDAVGEARLVLQAPSTTGTGQVSVSCGGVASTGYAQFATPTAPMVRLLPVEEGTLSGVIRLSLQANDPAGLHPGVTAMSVAVDGQYIGTATPSAPEAMWATYEVSNGNHTIQAMVQDGDGEVAYSQTLSVATSNPFFNVSVSNPMIEAQDPENDSTTITAQQASATDWKVDIMKYGTTTPVRTFTGSGTSVSATWDGKDTLGDYVAQGQYAFSIDSSEELDAGTESWTPGISDGIVFNNSDIDAPTALLVEGNYFGENRKRMDIIENACHYRGFQVIGIPAKAATWDRFQFYMNVYEPQVLYITSHGHYEVRTGSDCTDTTIPQVSQFMLKDAIVCAYRPQDNQGGYYTEYPESGEVASGYENLLWGKKYARYAQELYLYYYSALKLVFMDTCLCGRIGSGYGDTRQQSNPYEIVSGNDFAYFFGIYDNMYTNGASYCAFFELSFDDERYTHFIDRIFGSLRNGYSLDQATMRDAWNDSQCTGAYTDSVFDEEYGPSQYRQFAEDPGFQDLIDNFCFNWRVKMPPYHNLRVQGNPIAMRLNPY